MDGKEIFIEVMDELAEDIHRSAVEHGFWPPERNHAECIALMHSELSEALEAVRKDIEQPDEHCPDYSNVTVEMADCVIRIMDYCKRHRLALAEAILAKHEFNKSRPFKHGKEF